jgi:LuxR family maltose regulon positive regulatory protein
MATPLLTTKLYIPPARPDWVPRPHLIARLNAGLYHKVTLISAPAGSGKTTLASAWLSRLRKPAADRGQAIEEEPAHRDVAWLSLDEGDSDPARFFAYLLAALGTVEASLGQGVRHLLEASQLLPIQPLVAALINDLAARPEPLVLALDDYHTIDDLTIHEALSMLVERQPANLHLVLITRLDPPLPLSRLRGRGQVTEIRQGDLRFTSEEAARFLNESMGLQLAPSEVVLLESRTEGWIAGLQLAALSMQGRDRESVAGFIAGFSGRYHFLLDYLTDEVLGQQSEMIQTFLLRTSILKRMCGPLCDALLQTESQGEGKKILAHLEAANLFTVPLDDEHRWYRYHSLFGELLRARLQETQPEQLPELHRRAAAWYEQEGSGVEAVHHALASQDDELAAAVIERTITRLSTWSRADVAMIQQWLQALPDNVTRDRPWLQLFASRTLYVSGQPEAASRTLQELERWLRDHPELPDAERLVRLAIVDRASYAVVLGDVQQAKQLARQVLTGAPDDDPIGRFRTPAILGMAHSRAGEVSEAHRAFSQASEFALAAGLSFAAVPFLCNLADVEIKQARLRQAKQTCEQAGQLAVVDGVPASVAGFVGLEMSKILYEWNDLDAAEHHLLEGLELLSQSGVSESFGSGHAVLAQLKQALGDHEGARAAAQQALHIAQRDNIPRLIGLTSAYQARIWLAQGRLDLAARWARDYQQVGETEYLREFEDLTLVRALLAEGRPAETLALLNPMLSSATDAGRMGPVIEIQALRALAFHALDEPDAALDAIEQALAVAEPEGYVRLFVDLGQPIVALLKGAGSRGVKPQYISRLLAAFAPHEPLQPDLERQPLVEPLTDRELEVLQLLAGRLSNRELGRRLFISLPTVKSHTRSIYGKLGVHNREQAVARARALGILPPQ